MTETVNPRIHLNEIEQISDTPITTSSILSRRRDSIISAPIPIKLQLVKDTPSNNIGESDYLQNPNTLLPTVPDLTLNPPRTPESSSHPTLSLEPAPSLILNFDTTPLSMSISKKENYQPEGYEPKQHSMDSIRIGGNQPSGVNDRKTNSVSINQVLSCCEDSSQSKWNPWSIFTTTTRSMSPDPKSSSKPTNRSRLSLLPISPNKLNSRLNKADSNHSTDINVPKPKPNQPSNRSPKHSKSFILGNGQLLSLPKSLSNKHSGPTTPPPLSPPPPPPGSSSNYNTFKEIRKKSRRVSEWLSPMKYDRDAEEIEQVTDHSLKFKTQLKPNDLVDGSSSTKNLSNRLWTSTRSISHSRSEPMIKSEETSPNSSQTSPDRIQPDLTKTSNPIKSSLINDQLNKKIKNVDDPTPDLKIGNETRHSLRNSKLLNRLKPDLKIKSIW